MIGEGLREAHWRNDKSNQRDRAPRGQPAFAETMSEANFS